jgi:hypothetical protein
VFLYARNTIFALKPIVILLSIELWFFIPSHSRKHNHKSIGYRKLPRTNLRKDLLGIMKQVFVHLWHLRIWRRSF